MKAKKKVLPLFVPLGLTDILLCAGKSRCKPQFSQLYLFARNDECRIQHPMEVKYVNDTKRWRKIVLRAYAEPSVVVTDLAREGMVWGRRHLSIPTLRTEKTLKPLEQWSVPMLWVNLQKVLLFKKSIVLFNPLYPKVYHFSMLFLQDMLSMRYYTFFSRKSFKTTVHNRKFKYFKNPMCISYLQHIQVN